MKSSSAKKRLDSHVVLPTQILPFFEGESWLWMFQWLIYTQIVKKKKKQCNKGGPDEFYLGKCLFKQWQKHQLDIAVYTEMQSFLHVIRHLWKIFGFSEVRGDFAVGFDRLRTLSSECGGLRLWQWLQLLQPIPAPSRCAWGSAADKRRASQICPQYCL